MKPFNLAAALRGEKVVTRAGLEYTFGAFNPDAPNESQIIGWLADKQVITHHKTGCTYANSVHHLDLFMAPAVREGWINIYPRNTVTAYRKKSDADYGAAEDRIACIKITYTEGEGL